MIEEEGQDRMIKASSNSRGDVACINVLAS